MLKIMKLFSAKDARNELLRAILDDISIKAKNGHSSYHHFEPLSDECIKSLTELGYKVEHPEPSDMSVTENIPKVYDDYYAITW